MVFIVLLSIVGALLVLQYLLLFYAARYSASIPTIQPSYPIVGNIPSFWGKSSKQALWAVVKSFQRVDRMGKLMIGPKPILLVNHPDLLQQILMRGDLHDKPFFYDFMGLGGGLITERDGKRWLMERKVLNPTFNTRMLTSFLPIMDARARKMVANLGPMADGRTVVDLLKYVGECTLEIVFNTTMGRNANELPGQREYVKHLDMEDGTSFTDQEISDNLYTMMSAAHETSALTVSYTCLLLAMHPKIQAKVIAEMNEVFYDSSVEITLDTLKQLEYTERVIKEVLRLLPAVPIGARQTNSELFLDGVQIPKNQILAFNCYNLHRRTDFWGPDPERFDPDRFLPEASQGRHPYAYIPFSAGLRNCIGMRYAMNSMRIMLLRILQEFEIGTDLKQTDLRFKFEITLKLVGPHSVWLKRRDKI
ncbi:hypothetical protein quinque_000904 [Culex quinquefasciatus]